MDSDSVMDSLVRGRVGLVAWFVGVGIIAGVVEVWAGVMGMWAGVRAEEACKA